jgi:hypothetical protein
MGAELGQGEELGLDELGSFFFERVRILFFG